MEVLSQNGLRKVERMERERGGESFALMPTLFLHLGPGTHGEKYDRLDDVSLGDHTNDCNPR